MVACQDPSFASASAFSLLCSQCDLSNMCAGKERDGRRDNHPCTAQLHPLWRLGHSEKKGGGGARRGSLGVGGSRDITIQNVQLQTGDRLLHLFSHNSCPASNRRQGMGKRKGKAKGREGKSKK